MPQTILVVEDNPITRKMLRLALQAEGYAVLEAPDGRTALELTARANPDLIIQDLLLSDMDGLALIKELRAQPAGAGIPVLAFSGFLGKIEQARTMQVGFTDYLFKPVDPSRLVEVVRTYLPRKSAEEHGRARRILAVDDDPVQLKLLRISLENRGFVVQTAPDGLAALERAREWRPDGIVSDVLMPRLDGFRLCHAVRGDPDLSATPVVLTTSAYVEEADRELGKAVGANGFVLRTPDSREAIEHLFAGLSSAPPMSKRAVGALAEQYTQRVFRQLERQVHLNTSLATRLALHQAELSILGGIDQGLKGTATLEDAVAEMLYRCLDSAGVSKGGVYLLDAHGRLTLRACLGYPETDHKEIEELFGHTDLLHDAMAQDEPLRVPPTATSPQGVNQMLEKLKAKSMLLAPVGAFGDRFGVLMMASGDMELKDDWVSFIQAVASQTGHAVALLQAFAETDRQRRVAEVLTELVGTISASLDLDTILQRVAEGARELCRCDQALIALRARGSDAMVFRYWSGTADHGYSTMPVEPGKGSGGVVLTSGRPFRTDNYVEDRRITNDDVPTVEGRRVVAQLVVPIRTEERIEGLLYAENNSPRPFTKQEEDVLLRLANHAAIAIINAQHRETLHQSAKLAAMGTLLAGVAHELNNPLSVVIGYATLIHGAAAGGPVAERAEKMMRAAQRCGRIVRNFLSLARKQPPERHEVRLNTVIQEALEFVAYPLRVNNIEVVLDMAEDLPPLWADAQKLHQVVVNLVTNAQQAMREAPRPRHLTITTGYEGGRVSLRVTDTGPGIARDVQARIFEPFFTTKALGQGTGLGLALCRAFIEEHRGTLRVESEPGRGATFHIELPLGTPHPVSAPPAPVEAAPTEAAPAAAGKSILVVDDEDDISQLLSEILSEDGHRVVTAPNGARALEKLGPARYDVVFSDIGMPEMDGVAFYRELERRHPALLGRVVFITGDELSEATREFLARPGILHVNKPFVPEEIHRIVRHVLASSLGANEPMDRTQEP